MSTESEMLTWKAEGLPSDDLSVENAVVLLHTQQVPLVIDPSAQAAEWLRKHLREKVASMEVVSDEKIGRWSFGKYDIRKRTDRCERLCSSITGCCRPLNHESYAIAEVTRTCSALQFSKLHALSEPIVPF